MKALRCGLLAQPETFESLLLVAYSVFKCQYQLSWHHCQPKFFLYLFARGHRAADIKLKGYRISYFIIHSYSKSPISYFYITNSEAAYNNWSGHWSWLVKRELI